MSWYYWALLVTLWVGAGLLSVFLLLHRRGHRESAWYIIGAVLGPLFAPIAAERARRRSTVLDRHVEAVAAGNGRSPDGRMSVLVGVDGSAESDQAVHDAARLVAPVAGRILLVTVVGADSAEQEDAEEMRSAGQLLRRYVSQLPADGATVETEILSGQPVQAILDAAEAEHVDLLVVGRRGRGLSERLLGSVAQKLTSDARHPVLLASPPDPARRQAADRNTANAIGRPDPAPGG